MPDRPIPGEVEQRTAPEAVPTVEGRRLRGLIPYSKPSKDLGGFTEIIEPGALANADLSELVATVDHQGVPLARYPGTLEVEDRSDGLHWSLEPPQSRPEIIEAVERQDLRSTSWRMVVGRDEWRGNVRHVHEIAALRDVAVVLNPAYAEARAEYRAAPAAPDPTPPEPEPTPRPEPTPEEAVMPEGTPAGGLQIEDRTADNQPNIESRIGEAIRSIRKGESRSLTTADASGGPIAPTDVSTFMWDRMRPASIALASGLIVIPTDRQKVTWPQLVSDVDPTWVAELEAIPTGDPGFATLAAEPKKLAHLVSPISNEVIDDSEPSAVDVLTQHLITMLGLKLDASIFEGNATANPDSINGLKFTAGIQTVDMGTNGLALTDYDPFIEAVGKLRRANVPGPYAIAIHPDVLTELELLKRETGSNEQLGAPVNLPPFYTSSQLATTEAKGTASNARSAYVYAPAQLVLVNRKDAQVELDRSRLFNQDASEMRGRLRCDLLAPNPTAICRITGIIPA